MTFPAIREEPFFAWGICRGCAGPFAGKPAPTHRSAVDTHRVLDTGRRRSGFTREWAGPAGQYPWPFTVAVACVFAGKPAPTPDRWWTHIGDWAQPVVGAGLPAKGPVQANKKPASNDAGFLIPHSRLQAALASCWLSERFSALNSALKLAVVMFSSIPTPCTGRPPATRSSM